MLAEGFRVCAYCGEPFVQGMRTRQYCSDRCRREYQNHRRRLEREVERRKRLVKGIVFCSVCGMPMQIDSTAEVHDVACSPCCRAIRERRAELGLPPLRHKPLFAFAMNLPPVCWDPWRTDRLPEEVTENALADGGMAMPEYIDDIEYYRLKIESLYNAGGPKDETAQKAVPSPAEPEKPKKHKRGKRCRLMHR